MVGAEGWQRVQVERVNSINLAAEVPELKQVKGNIIGDILLGVNGDPVRDTDDLRAALGPETAGQPATLRVLRGGELRELAVTIGER